LLNSGAAKDAQQLLQAAVAKKAKPEASLLYLLAESQRQMKDYDGASATVRQLRAAFPDDTRGLLMEAQLQLAQGRREEALGTFAALVKRVPDQAIIAYQYAQLLQDAGRIQDAEQVLRSVLARDPMDANALNSLGYMFAERGERLDEAVELLQRALKIEPGNPSFLDSLGWAFFKQGALVEAEKPLAEAAAKLPENSVIQEHLGDLRFRQQRYAEAIVAWERALAGDGESIDRAAIEKKLRDARSRVPKD
jgi:predicted Zn-dependent protease